MNMKEDKELFLKVDGVEPVFKNWPGEPYLGGVKVWINGDGRFFPCDQYTVCNPDAVREDGRRQAMILAIELADMSFPVKQDIFGEAATVKDIFSKYSYETIKKKLDAWKKEKETIRVRDEVVNRNNSVKMVITVPPKMNSNSVEYMSGIGKDGKVYKDVVTSSYKKTGVYVGDLDAYLEV